MKIASNKLSELYNYYKNELLGVYEESELYAIFELVCEKYLGFSKIELSNKFEDKINQSNLINIYNAGVQLKKGIPIQYVLQEAYFYDSYFYVNDSVLIPRPETEELVDLIVKSHNHNIASITKIIDIGTGSGCIPITLKKNIQNAIVFGLDISEDAIAVAKKNALKNKVEVEFIKLDILNQDVNHFQKSIDTKFNIIVSNPPYIINTESQQMDARVLNHEPHLALFVEDGDAIIFYKRIIDFCKTYLEDNGFLYFELNPLTANDVKIYADNSEIFIFTELIIDMSGKKRFLKAQKK